MATGIEYLNSPEKRAMDIVGSLFMLAPAAATAGLSAAVLSREIGGRENAMFNQSRVIKGGRRVTIPKLRTINPKVTEGKPPLHMGALDPRAGVRGKIIRQLGLDETPQIWSVFRGHMSLVGPRPRPDFELEEYQQADPELFDEWYDFITAVKPGLFGLSQVMRHSHADATTDFIYAESMRMELEYRDEASLGTDIGIIIGTPPGLAKAAVSSYREYQAA